MPRAGQSNTYRRNNPNSRNPSTRAFSGRGQALGRPAELGQPEACAAPNAAAARARARAPPRAPPPPPPPAQAAAPRPRPRRRQTQRQLAIQEIRRYQNTTETLIPAGRVAACTREAAQDALGNGKAALGIRFQKKALGAVHQALEAFGVGQFDDATLTTGHAKRVTTFPKDMQLARRLGGTGNKSRLV